MKALRIVAIVVVLLVLAVLALGGPGGIWMRLNPLGQQRFTVEKHVYGVERMSLAESQLEIALLRVMPSGTIDQSDVDRIAAVEGITLADGAGGRLPVKDVVLRPDAGEGGFASLVFDVSGHTGPWTLEWPGNDSFQFEM